MSDLSQFLINTARTLSQMALYSPEHPSVKGAIDESYRLLGLILENSEDLTLSLSEGKLVVNGEVPEDVPENSLRPFVQLLTSTDLHSLSFTRGIRPDELIPFYRLTSKSELRNVGGDVNAYLANNKVEHIKCNLARYAKISETETVGAKPEGAGGAGSDGKGFAELLENLPLNDLIRKLIEKAVDSPEDRKKLFDRALSLVKAQIDESVNKVVKEFAVERTRLTNERERTEGVVEKMADGMVVVDEAGRVIMMNPAAEAIYGVKLGDCLGKPLWEGVREEQMVSLAKDLTVPTDRPIVKEVQIHGSEEAKKTLRASTAAVQDVNGRVVGMVSVLSDVTKQKELTRMQNEFMANVTHDLRAPMHAVKLAVGAILEGAAGPVTGEQQKMLGMASKNVDRLSRLIDDLLDFSKLESGAMEIRPQIVELAPLLQEATGSLEAWARSRSITLSFVAGKDLPPVYADSDRILQVVNNLISNAIKFTPAGGRITLSALRTEEAGKPVAVVAVEDTGPGISKADQERIFQRFVQLRHNEKLDIRGTGLGLSICKALVELHKGRLWIESPPKNAKSGSLFAFTLPTVQRATATKSAAPAAAAATPAAAPKPRSFWKKLFGLKTIALVLAFTSAAVALERPRWGTVRRVLEPTLIQLEDGTLVRYLGVSGPPKGDPHYPEAFAAARMRVEKQDVRFTYGTQERGADGVWVAYVFVDGVFMNEELVRDGLALVTPLPNDERVLPDLLAAERDARRRKRGMWKDSALEDYATRSRRQSGLPPAAQPGENRGDQP